MMAQQQAQLAAQYHAQAQAQANAASQQEAVAKLKKIRQTLLEARAALG